MSEVCTEHKKKYKYHCVTCDKPICTECIVDTHSGHKAQKPTNLLSKKIELLTEPLNYNLKLIREIAIHTKLVDLTIRDISLFFQGYHEAIILEEHKLKRSISEHRQQLHDMMKSVATQIKIQYTLITATIKSESSQKQLGSNSSTSSTSSSSNESSSLENETVEITNDISGVQKIKIVNPTYEDIKKNNYSYMKDLEVEEIMRIFTEEVETMPQLMELKEIEHDEPILMKTDEIISGVTRALTDHQDMLSGLKSEYKTDPLDILYDFKVNHAKMSKSIADMKEVYNLVRYRKSLGIPESQSSTSAAAQPNTAAPAAATAQGVPAANNANPSTNPIHVASKENEIISIGGYMKKYTEETQIYYIYVLCGMESTQHLSTVEVYDLKNDRWGVVEPTRMKRACSSASVACTNEHIFIFGGNDTLNTFERFNINTRKWDCLDSIPTKGGSSLACCYDNGRYIYLVGGIQNNVTMDRIDRFDILTGKCTTVGQLKKARYYTYCCFYNDIIYTVGGTHKEHSAPYTLVNTIESFNTKENSSNIIFNFGGSERVEACTFDKREFIYFITCNVFCRFSIETNSIEKLANPPLSEGKFGLAMVFGYFDGDFRIYLIGGKEENQYCYTVSKGTWAPFRRKGKYTYFHGAIAVK